MKISQDEIQERQTILHVELDDNDIDPFINRAYQRVVQKANIPGFRKGKAPRSVIEQFYGKDYLLNEIIDSMLPEMTFKAIQENELDAVGLPSIDLQGINPIKFDATIPLRPEIQLNSYKDIRIEKEEIEVSEESIDERLEQLRLSIATWEPFESEIEEGNMITAQIKCSLSEEILIEESDAVYLVNEEIGRPFPGFSTKLIGLKVDTQNSFNLEINDDFNDSKLAGQTISCEVLVKDVKHRVLPELNDEFAKGIGEGYETLEELKEEIQTGIQTESEQQSNFDFREKIIESVINEANISVPPLLIQNESENIIQQHTQMVTQANMALQDYLQSIGKTEEELQNEAQEEAEGRIKRSFLISKIAEEENIEVSDEDIEIKMQEIFSNSDGEIPDSTQSEEMRNYLFRTLLTDKTIERLEKIASGKESDLPDETIDETEGE
ncbi:MAG: trigger factor [Dehalococcoidia bacterium]